MSLPIDLRECFCVSTLRYRDIRPPPFFSVSLLSCSLLSGTGLHMNKCLHISEWQRADPYCEGSRAWPPSQGPSRVPIIKRRQQALTTAALILPDIFRDKCYTTQPRGEGGKQQIHLSEGSYREKTKRHYINEVLGDFPEGHNGWFGKGIYFSRLEGRL